jgi:hypothetical protein
MGMRVLVGGARMGVFVVFAPVATVVVVAAEARSVSAFDFGWGFGRRVALERRLSQRLAMVFVAGHWVAYDPLRTRRRRRNLVGPEEEPCGLFVGIVGRLWRTWGRKLVSDL